jgi:hypothetical protein
VTGESKPLQDVENALILADTHKVWHPAWNKEDNIKVCMYKVFIEDY